MTTGAVTKMASILGALQAAITAYQGQSGTLPQHIALTQADYNSLQAELVGKLNAAANVTTVGSLLVSSINGVGVTVQP